MILLRTALALCIVIYNVIDVSETSSINQCYESNDINAEFNHCGEPDSEDIEQTWYQEGAFLRVINGMLTAELSSNSSKPKTIYAGEKNITEVKRGFMIIPSLEWLSLEDNLITGIESFVFEGLPQLVYLSLARNRIISLVEESFKGLDKLEVLNLNHNSLSERISFSITRSTLPSLTQLYLQNNQIQYIDSNDYQFLCGSNVRQLYLSNNSLYTFELYSYGDSTCFSYLTHLFLDGNGLQSFDVGKMPLEALSLDRNDFDSIPKINQELKFLSLSRNRINYINNLENATNVVRIILSYNSFRDNLYNYGKIQNFSSLEYLALDHSSIQWIPDGCFYNLPSLRNLSINDNQISYISRKAFGKLPALKELSLKNNQLQSFPGEESFGESNLTYLDLTNNRVENISSIQANKIPKLKVLKLAGNPVKRIEPLSVSSNTTILL